MLDRRRRNELEGVQELGRLSDEMVFSLGRAMRAPALTTDDLAVFERAASLFDLLASDDVTVPDRTEGMMLSTGGFLDAMHVVAVRAGGDELEAYARRLAELLRGIIDRGRVSAEEEPQLQSLRDLFAEVGEATLSRASELSLPRETHWPPMRQAI